MEMPERAGPLPFRGTSSYVGTHESHSYGGVRGVSDDMLTYFFAAE
jgi:hypothetical protein